MAADPAVVDGLAATDLFGSLSQRDLKTIAGAVRVSQHEPGKEITSQGELGIAFHLILEGTASVSVEGHAPHSLGPGDYFGEISMIDGKPRSATVTVDTPMRTAAITSWNFRPLLNEVAGLAESLLVTLCARIRKSESSA
jgi:CRP/FNR family cyclic AMP-dependent transcriptional regulator